jgi:hypothetical protein
MMRIIFDSAPYDSMAIFCGQVYTLAKIPGVLVQWIKMGHGGIHPALVPIQVQGSSILDPDCFKEAVHSAVVIDLLNTAIPVKRIDRSEMAVYGTLFFYSTPSGLGHTSFHNPWVAPTVINIESLQASLPRQ